MKILIYSVYCATPHFETDLELAMLHLNKSDEVHFLCCNGVLPTCIYNSKHNLNLCITCRLRYKEAFNLLGIPRTNMHFLDSSETASFQPNLELSTVSDIKAYYYHESDIGMSVASTLISRLKDHDFDVEKNKDLVSTALKAAALVHSSASGIVSRIRPEFVYLFNGRFYTHKPLMRICQRNNIAFKTHERAGSIFRYSTFSNVMCHDLAYNKANIEQLWSTGGDNKYDIGAKFFVDRRNRIVQSWEVFTTRQETGRLPEGFDTSRKNITIFTSSMDEFESVEGYGNPLYANDVDALSATLESLSHSDYKVYVRAHPNLSNRNNSQNRQTEEICRRYTTVRYIRPEENIDSYALMDASNKIITFGSTTGVEACYWGKPSILVGKSLYEDTNCCYVPRTREELISLLNTDITPKEKTGALKYGYWELSKGIDFKYFKPDGLFSGKFLNTRFNPPLYLRIINFIANLVGKGE